MRTVVDVRVRVHRVHARLCPCAESHQAFRFRRLSRRACLTASSTSAASRSSMVPGPLNAFCSAVWYSHHAKRRVLTIATASASRKKPALRLHADDGHRRGRRREVSVTMRAS